MTNAPRPILIASDVTFGFPERPDFLQPIRLAVRGGECWGIIGPNGAGKSTLLRLFAGLLAPRGGEIRLESEPLTTISPRHRAQAIAFLPQHPPKDLPNTALDVVLMGRFPHRHLGLFESAADLELTRKAMAVTETDAFADRPLSSLSGGEAQRVYLAAALAQQPKLLLLDEPTAALDLFHQLHVFSLLRNLATHDHLAVVVVTHDLNLALRFCTHVLLLHDGRPLAAGDPGDVLRPTVLEQAYRVQLAEITGPAEGDRWIVPVHPKEPRT